MSAEYRVPVTTDLGPKVVAVFTEQDVAMLVPMETIRYFRNHTKELSSYQRNSEAVVFYKGKKHVITMVQITNLTTGTWTMYASMFDLYAMLFPVARALELYFAQGNSFRRLDGAPTAKNSLMLANAVLELISPEEKALLNEFAAFNNETPIFKEYLANVRTPTPVELLKMRSIKLAAQRMSFLQEMVIHSIEHPEDKHVLEAMPGPFSLQ